MMARAETGPDEGPRDGVVLRTDALSKSFGGIQAVDTLDFSIGQGEIVAIIGPNGSGKTTFFNLIMHLYDASEGAIYFGSPGSTCLTIQPTGSTPWASRGRSRPCACFPT